MDFEPSDKVKLLQEQLERFMNEYVYPNETEAIQQIEESMEADPPLMKEIRGKAKALGLWNLFLPDKEYGAGLTNLEYAPLCEVMGRSGIAPRVFNCNAPDTGNREILAEFSTPEQKKQWLEPLLEGETRSCFSMTEPEVSGADPTGLQTRAELDGDEWVINGHKWYTSGAVGARLAIVMVVTDPKAPPHMRASQIIVPTDAPGFDLIRRVSVMGHATGPGHCEIRYENCRVPQENLLGPLHGGFMIAQGFGLATDLLHQRRVGLHRLLDLLHRLRLGGVDVLVHETLELLLQQLDLVRGFEVHVRSVWVVQGRTVTLTAPPFLSDATAKARSISSRGTPWVFISASASRRAATISTAVSKSAPSCGWA